MLSFSCLRTRKFDLTIFNLDSNHHPRVLFANNIPRWTSFKAKLYAELTRKFCVFLTECGKTIMNAEIDDLSYRIAAVRPLSGRSTGARANSGVGSNQGPQQQGVFG